MLTAAIGSAGRVDLDAYESLVPGVTIDSPDSSMNRSQEGVCRNRRGCCQVNDGYPLTAISGIAGPLLGMRTPADAGPMHGMSPLTSWIMTELPLP